MMPSVIAMVSTPCFSMNSAPAPRRRRRDVNDDPRPSRISATSAFSNGTDPDSDLGRLVEVRTVERNRPHRPPPHTSSGFLRRRLSDRSSIMMLPSRSRSDFPIRRDIGNQSIFEGYFLDLSWHVPQIDQQTIHFCHPHQRIPLGQAAQHPLRIEWSNPKRVFDGAGLGVDSALTDLELGAQFRRRHVWRKRRITQKIDSPQHIDDAARPGSPLAGPEWAWAFPAQCCSHCARQVAIFGIQLPFANVIVQADNLLVY